VNFVFSFLVRAPGYEQRHFLVAHSLTLQTRALNVYSAFPCERWIHFVLETLVVHNCRSLRAGNCKEFKFVC
jgi:hypothetical protein